MYSFTQTKTFENERTEDDTTTKADDQCNESTRVDESSQVNIL